MPARFDGIQSRMVDKVNNLYAYPSIWIPSDLSPQQNGEILFKDPTRSMDLSGIEVEYDPQAILAEYKISQFVGLRDLANAGSNETLSIDGIEYYVRQVNLKYDGKTCIAILEKK